MQRRYSSTQGRLIGLSIGGEIVKRPLAASSLVITQKLRLDEMAQSALVEAVQSNATFAFENREQLVELDVNPLILDGAGAVTAVDVLIRMARHIQLMPTVIFAGWWYV